MYIRCSHIRRVLRYAKPSKETSPIKHKNWLINPMRDDQPIMDHLNSYVGNKPKSYKLGVKKKVPRVVDLLNHSRSPREGNRPK